jgi:uncharacterized OsmC-like protein
MTQAKLTLTEGFKPAIQIRDHVVYADEPISDGGTDQAPTPVELVGAALLACAAITAKLYAQRKGWALTGVEIDLDMRRYKMGEYPGSETGELVNTFAQTMTFTGDLDESQRQRLLEIAGKCPVHRILTSRNVMEEYLASVD